jgi:carboxyl-terminal processing protease
MKKIWVKRRKLSVVAGFVCFFVLGGFFTGFVLNSEDDVYFKIGKNIDVFGKVYKEVATHYVDEVDPEKFMRAGIDGMLGTLDPYTVFIDEKQSDELDLLTKGKYGGIGVTIGVRDGYITVTQTMEGYAAARQGILTGDRIIEVDGKKVTGMGLENVRAFVRGDPGTEVKVKVEREGEKEPIEFVLVREEVQVKNVTYSGLVDNGIGYIKLDRFSRQAGDDLRLAIKDLRSKQELKGLILDERDNPGGLLDVAVDIVEKFVKKGNLIVSTKGRANDSERRYTAEEEPMIGDVPLIVLVNGQSASASEIVAGAIQDLDRGIIVGTRTFGKGLVQTISQLAYNTSLKITTAKYYTPSGRCIQAIDYMNKDKNGVFVAAPDSMKKQYKTLNGRVVYSAGGVAPDSTVEPSEKSKLTSELLRKLMFFKYANYYVAAHKEFPDNFSVADDLLKDFRKFIQEKGFEYKEDSEKKLDELAEVARKENYSKTFIDEIDGLAKQVRDEKSGEFDRHKDEIKRALKVEIVSRYKGQHGQIEAGFDGDKQLQVAIRLLKNKLEYERKLTAK